MMAERTGSAKKLSTPGLRPTRTWFGPIPITKAGSFYSKKWRGSNASGVSDGDRTVFSAPGTAAGKAGDLRPDALTESLGIQSGNDHLGFDFSAASTAPDGAVRSRYRSRQDHDKALARLKVRLGASQRHIRMEAGDTANPRFGAPRRTSQSARAASHLEYIRKFEADEGIVTKLKSGSSQLQDEPKLSSDQSRGSSSLPGEVGGDSDAIVAGSSLSGIEKGGASQPKDSN